MSDDYAGRDGPGDREWVAATESAASALFADVYARHVRSVYRYSLRVLRDVSEAEEITQEVFVLAWGKRTQIRIVDRSLLPWLLVAARNLALNRVKQIRRRSDRVVPLRFDGDAPGHPGADDEAMVRSLQNAIDDAVDAMSETDQTLFHLCISEGMTYQHAAAALNTSHGAVRNRLSRVRLHLRTTLTPHKEGLS